MLKQFDAALEIKAIDEDERVLEGWASTADMDRMGDILEPLGCEYDLQRTPIPFLLDHNHSDAVGEVEAAEVTARGVRFRARIRKIAEPGPAKDLCDHAWSLLKNGLRKSVSVGFLPLEREPLDGGGWRYVKWEWLELSAVAVPANAGAQVLAVRAAGGSKRGRVVRLDSGKGNSGKGHVVKFTRQEMRLAKIQVASDRRLASRKRCGLAKRPPIKLDSVEIVLAAARMKREAKAKRQRSGLRK